MHGGSRSIFATVRWALLALLAATLCLWVLSYWRGYTYEFRDWQRARLEDRRWGLQSGRGSITYWRHWYSWVELSPEAPLLRDPDVYESGWRRDPQPQSFFDGSSASTEWIGRFGFDMTRSRSRTYEFDRVVTPYWFIIGPKEALKLAETLKPKFFLPTTAGDIRATCL